MDNVLVFPNPKTLLTERAMLKVAQDGSSALKLALLENPALKDSALAVLATQAEPEVQARAIPKVTSPDTIQAIALQGDSAALAALIQHPLYFPVTESDHLILRQPWDSPSKWNWILMLRERIVFFLLITGQIVGTLELVEELEDPRGSVDRRSERLETLVLTFYGELLHRMRRNPAFLATDSFFLQRFLLWCFHRPGDHTAEAAAFLELGHPEMKDAMLSCWNTPVPVLEQFLAQAYEQDDVPLRQALLAHHTLPLAAQRRLWNDPDVRVRAWALRYGLAPAEVMLVLAQDPEIQREHLPPSESSHWGYRQIYGEVFEQIIRDRFGVEVGLIIY